MKVKCILQEQEKPSAYDYAVAGGYTGTEAQFQALLGTGPWLSKGFTPITCGTNDQIEAAIDNGYRAVGNRSFGFFVLNISASGLTFAGGMRYFFVFNVSQSYGSILSQSYSRNDNDLMICTVYGGVRTPWRIVSTTLDGASKYPSNKNLLDNWYFVNPINQRGIGNNVLLNAGYTLDRWKVRQSQQAKWVWGNGFYIMNTLESNYQAIDQPLSVSLLLNGTPVTISALYRDEGESEWKLISASGFWGTTISSVKDGNFNIGLTHEYPSSNLTTFRIVSYPGSTKVVIAVKLEVGNTQTLARQNSNGSWILNDPPPNRSVELTKCMSYQIFGPIVGLYYQMTGGNSRVILPTPVTLRTNPTVVGTPEVYGLDPNTPITGVTLAAISQRNNGVLITLNGATRPAWLHLPAGSGLDANP